MNSIVRAGRTCTAILLVAAGCFVSTESRAQEPGPVRGPADAPRTMLYRALERQAHDLLDARRKAVAALKTPEAVRTRQTEMRAKFLEALGELPEKTPLNARVVGRDQRDGYRVERVIYESRPGHHVTAALYLPDGPPPYPGVLVPCGHSQNGKAAETYQRASILLAKNGLAALCYDPIGQGERLQALRADGNALTPTGSTTEHTLAGIGALLVGRSLAGYRVWDGIRSLDYLASRPEIDPSRLGCTGNSGGGTLTAYLMALDDRIAVAAPSCYITSLERLFATIGPQDAEQNITGQVAFGMDHADYAILRAPKPTLFCVGTQDFFDIQGSWDTFREVKGIYGRFGFGERVELFESDEPHGFTKPRREAAVRWMRRWLLKADDAAVEPDFPIATDAQLQCTPTGQVLSSLHGKSVFDLNGERANELIRAREQRSPENLRGEVRRRIGLSAAISPARRIERGTEKRGIGTTVRKLIFVTEPRIVIPALEEEREAGDHAQPLVIILRTSASATQSGPFQDGTRNASRVIRLDLRGMGETTPDPPDKHGPFGADWREAFLALHVGRPLVGQRVGDLLSVILALESESKRGIRVVADGPAAIVALHAAALEPRITELAIDSMLASWADVCQSPLSRDMLASVVPGALAVYDLPDLASLVAPRPLTIRAATDAEGWPITQERLDRAYAASAATYRAQSANDKLILTAGQPRPLRQPLSRSVDLAIGESRTITLSDGKKATVKLLNVNERRDPIRGAIREAVVKAEINGQPVTLSSGNYNLPKTVAGVQVDCPITGGYRTNCNTDMWALEKDARLRLWPAGSPWIDPDAFTLPGRQRWFSTSTQMANEPSYVDGSEPPNLKKIYYHWGLDHGGAEGLVDVAAATDGVVVSAGTQVMKGFEKSPAAPRYDVIYLLDDRGWYYRYSHLKSFDPSIKVGAVVREGQKIGVLGKEGGSGGWSHLHVDITGWQPSGRFGIEEGYAFLWQTALREQKLDLVAVARPHHYVLTGEKVVLDGSKSWSRSGQVARFEWTFGDGSTATGAKIERSYERAGSYSEILKVTDSHGHVDYDFAIVQVVDRAKPDEIPPTLHAAYAPTLGIKPGDPVTFKVRSFRAKDPAETWDFGDGTPPVTVHSDGNANEHAPDGYAVTTHRFEKPGHYLVRAERRTPDGLTATSRLHVVIEAGE